MDKELSMDDFWDYVYGKRDKSVYNCNWSEFDLEMHKKTYINYLEVIILPDGKIVYAHPSHQEKLLEIGCKNRNITRSEYIKIWESSNDDPLDWLLKDTDCISVWTEGIRYGNEPTKEQYTTINMLIDEGLLRE